MSLPKWTIYPALAILTAGAIVAIPVRSGPAPAATTPHRRVLVLGIDGMDPDLLKEAIERYPDRMRNFAALVKEGSGIQRLGTSNPPQSPVAWSNFITGMDPGGHGIFDFIHRDPMTRDVAPSVTKSEVARNIPFGDWQFPVGGDSESNRTGRAFWELLQEAGVPADIWRMPANFPVVESEGWSFSGMMTPAVDSAYGEYHLYTTNPPPSAVIGEGRIEGVRRYGDLIELVLRGPVNPFRKDMARATTPLRVHIDPAADAAVLEVGGQPLILKPGQWSEFAGVSFDLLPAGAMKIDGTVRFLLKSITPVFELYASPINIDPESPMTPVSEPNSASADVAREIGRFYTQGMPEDVNALKDKALSDREFLGQSDLVHDEGVRMMDLALRRWRENERGGFAFFYFSGVDLCGHMLWRHHDEDHPHHDADFAARDLSDWSGIPGDVWKNVVFDLYLRMDPVLGRIREAMPPDALLIVMSDHGFESYRRKFNLNTWLLENGYLVLKPGLTKELPREDPQYRPITLVNDVDWSKTRAYGVGFNALYLNLKGRELDNPATPEDESGIVEAGAQADALMAEIAAKLVATRDGERQPVLRVDRAVDAYHGPRVPEAPDLLVGYNAGYGNSDPSTLGRVPGVIVEDNLGGTFNGNHLMAPEVVEGTLLTNGKVLPGTHKLEDLTVEILRQYGIQPGADMRGRPVLE
ncbi:MAG: hypothetical protein RL277_480 [Planctomycetota bacterium]|jgi:predicted AlkP superfamily phosphohydrolase/phosphomutase